MNNDYAQRIVDAYSPYVSADLAVEIVAVAERIGADPGYLADLINYETAGTFDPAIENPKSTATGLIQFLEKTAQSLGTSTAELAKMTAIEQMAYVQAYLKPYAPLAVESDLYMAVFYPAAIGKGLDYAFGESVTAVNASQTVRDYVEAVRRKSKLGKLLPSSSGGGGIWLAVGLLIAAAFKG